MDCADRERVETAKSELHAMLEEEDLANAILLVMANKQDMKGASLAPAFHLSYFFFLLVLTAECLTCVKI